MQKSIEIAKSISKNLSSDNTYILEEHNLYTLFLPVLNLNPNISITNAIVAYIIYAYDNDSNWLNFKQDRVDCKIKILTSLGVSVSSNIFSEIINNDNSIVNDVIGEYLIEQTTWKWRHIMTLLDYHSNMIRFATQKTEEEKSYEKMNKEGEVKSMTIEYDIDKISKVNKQKGELLEQSLKARREADTLLSEIRKEFVQLDNAVQADFNFQMTDEKKIDTTLWRDWIRHEYLPNKKKQN